MSLTIKMKYHGFANPYSPGLTESIYHVMPLYRKMSTINIHHTIPILRSPLTPLGG